MEICRHKVISYKRMMNGFTAHSFPYYNGVIIGFFDTIGGSPVREDYEEIIGFIRSKVRDQKGLFTSIDPTNLRLIEYDTNIILIYHNGDPIKWNNKKHCIYLYAALDEYTYIIHQIINNQLSTPSRIAKLFGNPNDLTLIKYYENEFRIFGKDMIDKPSVHYRAYCDDLIYRAFRNAVLRVNKGFKDNKDSSIVIPAVGRVLEEKQKLIYRITRGELINVMVM